MPMIDFCVWEPDRPRRPFQVFESVTPEYAMQLYAEENDVDDGEILCACESVKVRGQYEKKPGGKAWSAQISVEMKPEISVGELVEDDPIEPAPASPGAGADGTEGVSRG